VHAGVMRVMRLTVARQLCDARSCQPPKPRGCAWFPLLGGRCFFFFFFFFCWIGASVIITPLPQLIAQKSKTPNLQAWTVEEKENSSWSHPWCAGPNSVIIRRLLGLVCVGLAPPVVLRLFLYVSPVRQ